MWMDQVEIKQPIARHRNGTTGQEPLPRGGGAVHVMPTEGYVMDMMIAATSPSESVSFASLLHMNMELLSLHASPPPGKEWWTGRVI